MGVILFGIPAAIIAYFKGFKPFRWLFAFGLIGLVVLLFLKSAKADYLPPEDAAARADKANAIGAWMCGIALTLTFFSLFYIMATM